MNSVRDIGHASREGIFFDTILNLNADNITPFPGENDL